MVTEHIKNRFLRTAMILIYVVAYGLTGGVCVAQDYAKAGQYLAPPPSLLHQNDDVVGYYSLLRNRLTKLDERPRLGSAVWFSALIGAHAVELVYDEGANIFVLTGAKEEQSLWASFKFWQAKSDRVRGDFVARESAGSLPKPADVKIHQCESEIPRLLSERTIWLWDTALLNLRLHEIGTPSQPEKIRMSITTRLGSGELVNPRAESMGGNLRLVIHTLHELCWLGTTPKRLNVLKRHLDRLHNDLSAMTYRKGRAWAKLEDTDFAASQLHFEAVAQRN